MTDVRLIKYEAVPNCGSYEVRYSDGRPSRHFYWDDLVSRRLDPNTLTGEQAGRASQSPGASHAGYIAELR